METADLRVSRGDVELAIKSNLRQRHTCALTQKIVMRTSVSKGEFLISCALEKANASRPFVRHGKCRFHPVRVMQI